MSTHFLRFAGAVATRLFRGKQSLPRGPASLDAGSAFDHLARAVAEEVPRREALRRLGGGLATALLASLGMGEALGQSGRCPFGQTRCSGVCVNLRANSNNCGSCGNVCPSGTTCRLGRCASAGGGGGGNVLCRSGETRCGLDCVNLKTDTRNCGSCGKRCATGEGCCNGVCTPLNTAANCGACGRACVTGADCVSGQCVCPNGGFVCGSGCCANGGSCANGTCVTCGADQYVCGSTCCDNDSSCCGGVACCPLTQSCCDGGICCAAGLSCIAGSCLCASNSQPPCNGVCCAAGQQCCSNTCVSLTDPQHCGQCGYRCPDNFPICAVPGDSACVGYACRNFLNGCCSVGLC